MNQYRKIELQFFIFVRKFHEKYETKTKLRERNDFSLLFDGTAIRHEWLKFIFPLLAPPFIAMLLLSIICRWVAMAAGASGSTGGTIFASTIILNPFFIVFLIYRYLIYKEIIRNNDG